MVVEDGERVGRLYVARGATTLHVLDLTLLPRFRSRRIGRGLVLDLIAYAREHAASITLRVPRRNLRAGLLYSSVGFDLLRVDDLDKCCEWTPPPESAAKPDLLRLGSAGR